MSKNQNIMITLGGVSYLDITTIEKELIPLLVNGGISFQTVSLSEQKYNISIACKDKDTYFNTLRRLSACVSD